MVSGYWHITLHPDDTEKLVFVTNGGLYEWLKLALGCRTTPRSIDDQQQFPFSESPDQGESPTLTSKSSTNRRLSPDSSPKDLSPQHSSSPQHISQHYQKVIAFQNNQPQIDPWMRKVHVGQKDVNSVGEIKRQRASYTQNQTVEL
ncbi:hypothetical protein TNCV_999521 [Trichonephila clavipes]|nr:hypothetical protein TNCV_999521 [Trichonephila clavipes]